MSLDHLPDALRVIFLRELSEVHRDYIRRCGADSKPKALNLLKNPGLQIYHVETEIGGVNYDFVATLIPKER